VEVNQGQGIEGIKNLGQRARRHLQPSASTSSLVGSASLVGEICCTSHNKAKLYHERCFEKEITCWERLMLSLQAGLRKS